MWEEGTTGDLALRDGSQRAGRLRHFRIAGARLELSPAKMPAPFPLICESLITAWPNDDVDAVGADALSVTRDWSTRRTCDPKLEIPAPLKPHRRH